MNNLEKLPPQALEMESNVLGAMLIDGDAAAVAVELLRPEDFYRGSHRIIFAAAAELHAAGQLDQALLRQALAAKGLLDEVGGITCLAELAATVATSAHVEHYCRIVKECAKGRQIISALTHTLRDAFESSSTADSLLATLDAEIMRINGDRTDSGSSAVELADDLLRQVVSNDHRVGLLTGIPVIDDVLGGLRPGELILGAARPNVGKTTKALNVLATVASSGIPVLFFSLEMNRQAIAKHLVRQRTGVDLFRNPNPQGTDLKRVQDAALELRGLPFTVLDGSMDMAAIRSRTRRAVTKGQCGLVVIDYLQRIQTPTDADNRCQAIGAIGRALKSLAVDAGVPVLALCQLNRQSEQREDRRPRLSDLRDSGELEQEADAVLLLHRPNRERPVAQGGDDGLLTLDLAKSRNTATGEGQMWLDLGSGVLHADEFGRNSARTQRLMINPTTSEDGSPVRV